MARCFRRGRMKTLSVCSETPVLVVFVFIPHAHFPGEILSSPAQPPKTEKLLSAIIQLFSAQFELMGMARMEIAASNE